MTKKKFITFLTACVLFWSGAFSAEDINDFGSLSLEQLLERLETTESVGMGFIADFTQRLIDIAYFDHSTSAQEREDGLKLIDGLIPEFEKLLAGDPDLLGAYRNAYQAQLAAVKYFGYGSLGWTLANAEDDEVADIISRPESGPLIPAFLEMMPPETWGQTKPSVLRSLIIDRQRQYEYNAVLILAGLVAGYDQVAWNVLTDEERGHLLDVAKEYKAARSVLVKYDLLPEKAVLRALSPTIETKFLPQLVILEMREPFDFLSKTNLREKYDRLNQEEFVSILLWTLRLKLWMDIVEGTYGKTTRESAEEALMHEFERARKEGFDVFLETLTGADNYRGEGSYIGPDIMIAVAFSDWYLPANATEKTVYELTRTVADLVNHTRVLALHKARYMLRSFAEYRPDGNGSEGLSSQEVKDEYLYMVHRLFGARAPKAEEALLLEDWIGYWPVE